MEIIEIIKQDYQNFPKNQTYSIYADDVYFKDPLNEFRGIQRYQTMIGFLGNFFREINLDLHDISLQENCLKTEWTLHLTSPLPWQPRLSIPGWSELKLNQNGLIIAHIDYWHISPWEVLKQNLFGFKQNSQ
ncbi:Protein of unknown function DUF2358 [Stanieria cyanosphaera PCC 7437]|uniref:SnoaL-like domain-containing protein n=1 Tax=Stanieria cyanosphaera (strain ATCC 29371 / PCC 7437) TaxID=111780 RepID=K9XUH7_STAC7|nr:DUF2358 domain-containing protein [Stanieria cyanosphaera]AFZ35714.1 Protein of unknown function DUF2358 [Stanieria cyanosphaera PCC 7437]